MNIELLLLLTINVFLFLFVVFYILYNKLFLGNKIFDKKEIEKLRKSMRAEYFHKGFYMKRHEVILANKFDYLYTKDINDFNVCYDCFVYENSRERWEVFISRENDDLLQDNDEKLNIRVFTRNASIKSSATVERVLSHISILSNNNYLIDELSRDKLKEEIEGLIKTGDEILILDKNIIHYKTKSFPKKITSRFVVNRIKSMKRIREITIREGILEY